MPGSVIKVKEDLGCGFHIAGSFDFEAIRVAVGLRLVPLDDIVGFVGVLAELYYDLTEESRELRLGGPGSRASLQGRYLLHIPHHRSCKGNPAQSRNRRA